MIIESLLLLLLLVVIVLLMVLAVRVRHKGFKDSLNETHLLAQPGGSMTPDNVTAALEMNRTDPCCHTIASLNQTLSVAMGAYS